MTQVIGLVVLAYILSGSACLSIAAGVEAVYQWRRGNRWIAVALFQVPLAVAAVAVSITVKIVGAWS